MKPMRTAVLISEPSTDDGTFGMLTCDTGESFNSLELPWEDNANGISCIPEGVYIFRWVKSPKHGWCYEAEKVPNRTHIQIHSANWAGDKSKGKRCELLGCIALGNDVGVLKGQNAILGSAVSVKKFNEIMNKEPFELTIARE